MRRPRIQSPDPWQEPPNDPEWIHEVRHYKLITPLYGGGVEPGKNDPIRLIRGTTIRGHLRFWWRATRGGQWGNDIKRMREEEDAIWGSAAGGGKGGQSKVKTRIAITSEGTPKYAFRAVQPYQPNRNNQFPWRSEANEQEQNFTAPGYASFPMRPENDKLPRPTRQRSDEQKNIGETVRKGIEFHLTLSFPVSREDDVYAALWAWETFGGVGARTRRGFGALQLLRLCSPSTDQWKPIGEIENPKEYIKINLDKHVVSGVWPNGIPHLEKAEKKRFRITRTLNSSERAWIDIIKRLRDFAQWRERDNPSLARRNPRDPGRSLWPEPDAIRAIQKEKYPDSELGHRIRLNLKKFPRAQLTGLPKIFKFKEGDVRHGDPERTTLELTTESGGQGGRFTSPLILRPVACSGGAFGVVLVLSGSRLPDNRLILYSTPDQREGSTRPLEAQVTSLLDPGEGSRIEPMKKSDDILQAFLDSF